MTFSAAELHSLLRPTPASCALLDKQGTLAPLMMWPKPLKKAPLKGALGLSPSVIISQPCARQPCVRYRPRSRVRGHGATVHSDNVLLLPLTEDRSHLLHSGLVKQTPRHQLARGLEDLRLKLPAAQE